jgi:HEPN domain-containing protein
MRNDRLAKAALEDAEIILQEARDSLARGHYHRVVRKCQEATELAVKGLFRHLGLEYPKWHVLGRLIRKELARFGLFERQELVQMATICDRLAFDRAPSFYGAPDGTPASELFDEEDAAEALAGAEWVVERVKSVIADAVW